MSVQISPAASHELLPALRLLFSRGAESVAGVIAADRVGVFVARDDRGRVGAAAMVEALPGALAVTWPPRAGSHDVADALAVAVSDWLRRRGVKVCQAFVSAEDAPAMAPLEQRGFRHVTQLVSMRRDVSPGAPPFTLTFAADRPPFGEAFRTTLLATYEATRDCPELTGTRTADELLAGFDNPAPGGAWYLASHEGTPVGVVMFAGADPDVELSYVGVVPRARGRGFGGELLAFVQAEAARMRAAALTVAVDARNEPALRLYRRHGFTETERREVWLAQFPGI